MSPALNGTAPVTIQCAEQQHSFLASYTAAGTAELILLVGSSVSPFLYHAVMSDSLAVPYEPYGARARSEAHCAVPKALL